MSSHSHADYKGNTGVRARKDLSANHRSPRTSTLTPKAIIETAQQLQGEIRRARASSRQSITIAIGGAEHVVDALLSVEHLIAQESAQA